jgi:hypothetical protein
MYFKPLLLPLLAQVFLTFTVMIVMYLQRVSEMKSRKLHPQKMNTRSSHLGKLPDSEASANNYANLFESPVLFYVAILLALILMLQDSILVYLAWFYVLSRYVHSFIHITYNRVMHRFTAFIASCFFLAAMWFRLGWIIIQA